MILFGPSGTGKVTLTFLVTQAGGREYVQLSVISAGVKEACGVVDSAKRRLNLGGKEAILSLDKVHRFSELQQDSLLSAVENCWVIPVAATTENPTSSVISPPLSRSLLLDLWSLGAKAISMIVKRALANSRGLGDRFQLTEAAREAIVHLVSSDRQKPLTPLEAAADGAASRGASEIATEGVAATADTTIVRYSIDEHYDVALVFIKPMHGSDLGVALYYLARTTRGGEDLRFIMRYVVIAAAKGIGLAGPTVLPLVVAVVQAVQLIGMLEGRISLAEMVVAMATAPKSNRTYLGINAALNDVGCGNIGRVSTPLCDQHSPEVKEAHKIRGSCRYPHDDPCGIPSQQYLLDGLRDKTYYQPSSHGYEAAVDE